MQNGISFPHVEAIQEIAFYCNVENPAMCAVRETKPETLERCRLKTLISKFHGTKKLLLYSKYERAHSTKKKFTMQLVLCNP